MHVTALQANQAGLHQPAGFDTLPCVQAVSCSADMTPKCRIKPCKYQCPATSDILPEQSPAQQGAHMAGRDQCPAHTSALPVLAHLAVAHNCQQHSQDGCPGRQCSTHSKVPTGKATSLLPLVLSPIVVLMILLRPTSASLATVRSLLNSTFCSSKRLHS